MQQILVWTLFFLGLALIFRTLISAVSRWRRSNRRKKLRRKSMRAGNSDETSPPREN
ncbi:hypothetical protein S1OALGB6SA_2336 [Olavius algarvensis spirochete endosymbiont]|nr:hypothetical protein S1OALGB6SA_2336 [Olavius algarvensis spirochete endosymbiont]